MVTNEYAQALANVSAKLDKDSASILAASDDRELLSQGQDDFLPYELGFDAVVEIVEVKAKKTFDARGLFVTLRVESVAALDPSESDAVAREIKVNKTYVVAFFDTHKTIPQFVLGQMARSRKEFAAAVAGVSNTDDFKAAPVLVQLHQEVEPLGIRMRFTNRYVRTTRPSGANPKGKRIHALEFALV